MAAASSTSRMAGSALKSFLGLGSGILSEAAENAVLKRLSGAEAFADAPGIRGMIARNPQAIAKLAGGLAPVATTSAVAGGVMLANQLLQQPLSPYARSPRSLPLSSYSNQQYVPGSSPFTNLTAGRSMLEEQRFQNQLALIEARQAAQNNAGSLARSSGLDMMGLAQQVFKPSQY